MSQSAGTTNVAQNTPTLASTVPVSNGSEYLSNSINSVSCNNCMHGPVCESVPLQVRSYNPNSYLSASDLTLPNFHDSSKINAVYHLN
jgi:hypothetical protein